jgi:S-adenosylmethionine/arginine decarboxylase-like enzyme
LATFAQVTADFAGVAPALLRDHPTIAGLLVAAASAAGLSTAGPPVVRVHGDEGVTAALWLGGGSGHVIVHTVPATGQLLLELLVPVSFDPERAIDVFVRRVGASNVRRARGLRG